MASACRSIPDLLSSLLAGDLLGVLPDPIGTLPLNCFKLHLSVVIGYAIVAGSALVKVPQIVKIARAKSVSGMAFSSVLMENFASITSFCYYVSLGYPFSTWGENFFIFFQNLGLMLLFLHFAAGLFSTKSMATVLSCGALGTVLYGQLLPDVTIPSPACAQLKLPRCTVTSLDVAGGLPTLLLLVGRLPQIRQNFVQGHAGQLSLITYLLNTVGGLARVFTTIQQLNDPIALFSVVVGLLQNTALLLQILILGCAPNTAAESQKKGKEKKST